MTDPADLRVGHQERQATITVLRTAAEEGRLTPEELEHRLHLSGGMSSHKQRGVW